MASLLAAQQQDAPQPEEAQPLRPPKALWPPDVPPSKGLARQPRAEAGGVDEDLDQLAEATTRSQLTETMVFESTLAMAGSNKGSGSPKNITPTAAPSFYSVGTAALIVAKSKKATDGLPGQAEPPRRERALARGKTAMLAGDSEEAGAGCTRPARPALVRGRTAKLAADAKDAVATRPRAGDAFLSVTIASVATASGMAARRRKKLQGSRFTTAFGRQGSKPVAAPPPQSEEKGGSDMPQDMDADAEVNPWSGLSFRGKVTDWLQKMALETRIPIDILRQAHDIFSEHAQRRLGSLGETTQADAPERGVLSHDALATILCKLTNVESPDELPESLLTSCFLTSDSNRNRSLNFAEFALWFSRHGFNEYVLLSAEQREIRKLARHHGLPITTVEKYKSQFDAFDLDRSEKIEVDEFEKLLHVLLRIPKDLDLPQSRVRQFWLEAGPDAEGALSFEQFLVFYSRHFSFSDKLCPVQEFYRGLRRVHVWSS